MEWSVKIDEWSGLRSMEWKRGIECEKLMSGVEKRSVEWKKEWSVKS